MKRFILSGISILIVCCVCFCYGLKAAPATSEKKDTKADSSLEFSAKSVILIDQNTGNILYEKNSHEKMSPASITKIMVLILLMEAIESGKVQLTDIVTASADATKMGGSQIWLKEKEEMSVEDLLKATAIASANDAAYAIGEFLGGSEEAFIDMMNDKAKSLGMNDTTFMNATGLDADGHISSAYDVAIMSRELLKHEMIMKYSTIWMDSLRGGKTELVNTNKLVRFYKGCTGLKTGTTNNAGYCISASAKRDNLHIISVIMGSKTTKDRFDDAKKLLNYGFANFTVYKSSLISSDFKPIKVNMGVKNELSYSCENNGEIVVKKDDLKNIKEDISIVDSIDAPIFKGQQLGEIKLSCNGDEIASYPLTANEDIKKVDFTFAFLSLLKAFSEVF